MKKAREISTEKELHKQISKYHTNESLHSGINECYYSLKDKIFFPKIREHITFIINNCDKCRNIKHDRKPIKPKLKDIERVHSTFEKYNNRYNSTIKCRPAEAKEDLKTKQIQERKNHVIEKRNQNRETYIVTRKEGHIRNYERLPHKDKPSYKKHVLTNINISNIKRPLILE